MSIFQDSSVYLCTLIASLIGLSCGIAFTWTSPVLPKLRGAANSTENPLGVPITTNDESWITGLLGLGSILGPFLAGYLGRKIGRKPTLLLSATPISIAFLALGVGKTVYLFYFARFITGLGAGVVFTILPTYLSEIAEDHNRGAVAGVFIVFTALGAVFTYCIGSYTSIQLFSLLSLAPGVLFLIFFWIWNPETPPFLAEKGNRALLEKSLMRLRNKSYDAVQEEATKLMVALQQHRKASITVKEALQDVRSKKGLFLAGFVMVFQQFSGINSIMSYLQTIFDAAGSSLQPEISVVIISLVQLVATIASSLLVDRLGRKILLLASASGVSLALFSLGYYFHVKQIGADTSSIDWLPICSLIGFIIFFNTGLAPVPWTIMVELFPAQIRPVTSTICGFICFVCCTITLIFFPYYVNLVGMAGSFWSFASITTFGFIFIWYFLPETKGKSIEEIQELLAPEKLSYKK